MDIPMPEDEPKSNDYSEKSEKDSGKKATNDSHQTPEKSSSALTSTKEITNESSVSSQSHDSQETSKISQPKEKNSSQTSAADSTSKSSGTTTKIKSKVPLGSTHVSNSPKSTSYSCPKINQQSLPIGPPPPLGHPPPLGPPPPIGPPPMGPSQNFHNYPNNPGFSHPQDYPRPNYNYHGNYQNYHGYQNQHRGSHGPMHPGNSNLVPPPMFQSQLPPMHNPNYGSMPPMPDSQYYPPNQSNLPFNYNQGSYNVPPHPPPSAFQNIPPIHPPPIPPINLFSNSSNNKNSSELSSTTSSSVDFSNIITLNPQTDSGLASGISNADSGHFKSSASSKSKSQTSSSSSSKVTSREKSSSKITSKSPVITTNLKELPPLPPGIAYEKVHSSMSSSDTRNTAEKNSDEANKEIQEKDFDVSFQEIEEAAAAEILNSSLSPSHTVCKGKVKSLESEISSGSNDTMVKEIEEISLLEQPESNKEQCQSSSDSVSQAVGTFEVDSKTTDSHSLQSDENILRETLKGDEFKKESDKPVNNSETLNSSHKLDDAKTLTTFDSDEIIHSKKLESSHLKPEESSAKIAEPDIDQLSIAIQKQQSDFTNISKPDTASDVNNIMQDKVESKSQDKKSFSNRKLNLPMLGKEAAKKRLKSFSVSKPVIREKQKSLDDSEEKSKSSIDFVDDEKKEAVKKKKNEKTSVIEQIREEEMRIKEVLNSTSSMFSSYGLGIGMPEIENFLDNPEALKKFEARGKDFKDKLEKGEIISPLKNPIRKNVEKEKWSPRSSHRRDSSSRERSRESISRKNRDEEKRRTREKDSKSSGKHSGSKSSKPKIKEIPTSWKEMKKLDISFEDIKKISKRSRSRSRSRSISPGRNKKDSKENKYKRISNQKRFSHFPNFPKYFQSYKVNNAKNYATRYFPGSLIQWTESTPSIPYSVDCNKYQRHYWLRNELISRSKRSNELFDIIREFLKPKTLTYEGKSSKQKRSWYVKNWLEIENECEEIEDEEETNVMQSDINCSGLDLLTSNYKTDLATEEGNDSNQDLEKTVVEEVEEKYSAFSSEFNLDSSEKEPSLTFDKLSSQELNEEYEAFINTLEYKPDELCSTGLSEDTLDFNSSLLSFEDTGIENNRERIKEKINEKSEKWAKEVDKKWEEPKTIKEVKELLTNPKLPKKQRKELKKLKKKLKIEKRENKRVKKEMKQKRKLEKKLKKKRNKSYAMELSNISDVGFSHKNATAFDPVIACDEQQVKNLGDDMSEYQIVEWEDYPDENSSSIPSSLRENSELNSLSQACSSVENTTESNYSNYTESSGYNDQTYSPTLAEFNTSSSPAQISTEVDSAFSEGSKGEEMIDRYSPSNMSVCSVENSSPHRPSPNSCFSVEDVKLPSLQPASPYSPSSPQSSNSDENQRSKSEEIIPSLDTIPMPPPAPSTIEISVHKDNFNKFEPQNLTQNVKIVQKDSKSSSKMDAEPQDDEKGKPVPSQDSISIPEEGTPLRKTFQPVTFRLGGRKQAGALKLLHKTPLPGFSELDDDDDRKSPLIDFTDGTQAHKGEKEKQKLPESTKPFKPIFSPEIKKKESIEETDSPKEMKPELDKNKDTSELEEKINVPVPFHYVSDQAELLKRDEEKYVKEQLGDSKFKEEKEDESKSKNRIKDEDEYSETSKLKDSLHDLPKSNKKYRDSDDPREKDHRSSGRSFSKNEKHKDRRELSSPKKRRDHRRDSSPESRKKRRSRSPDNLRGSHKSYESSYSKESKKNSNSSHSESHYRSRSSPSRSNHSGSTSYQRSPISPEKFSDKTYDSHRDSRSQSPPGKWRRIKSPRPKHYRSDSHDWDKSHEDGYKYSSENREKERSRSPYRSKSISSNSPDDSLQEKNSGYEYKGTSKPKNVDDNYSAYSPRPIDSISHRYNQEGSQEAWDWGSDSKQYSSHFDSEDRPTSPSISPKRLSLDERLKQEHGVELKEQELTQDEYEPRGYYWEYNPPPPLPPNCQPSSKPQVIRVGNFLQVLPQDSSPVKEPCPSQQEQEPCSSQQEQEPCSSQQEQEPCSSQQEQEPCSSQQEQSYKVEEPQPPQCSQPPKMVQTGNVIQVVPTESYQSPNSIKGKVEPVLSLPDETPSLPPPVPSSPVIGPVPPPSSTVTSNPLAFISSLLASSMSQPITSSPVISPKVASTVLPKSSETSNMESAVKDVKSVLSKEETKPQESPVSSLDTQQQQAIISAAVAAAASGVTASNLPIAHLISVLQQQSLLARPNVSSEPLPQVEETLHEQEKHENLNSQEAQFNLQPQIDIEAFKQQRKERKERKKREREARRKARREKALRKKLEIQQQQLQQIQEEREAEEQLEKDAAKNDSFDEDDLVVKEAMTEVPELGSPIPEYEIYNDDDLGEEEEEDLKKTFIPLPDPPEKGILIEPSYRILRNMERKSVSFADGIMPGYGTSPSGGEEIHSPPPLILPEKEKKKKLRKKKKVKVRVIKQYMMGDNRMDSPPPPPEAPPTPGVLKLYPGCTHYTLTAPGTFVIYTQQPIHSNGTDLGMALGNNVTIPPGMLIHSSALSKNCNSGITPSGSADPTSGRVGVNSIPPAMPHSYPGSGFPPYFTEAPLTGGETSAQVLQSPRA